MNLNDFESFIDRKILARGRDYYENGRVLSVVETGNNEYEAKVDGTEPYTVDVELDGEGNIKDTVCNCPYDMGEYCKHQAAVFLTLRDMKRNTAGEDSRPTPQSAATDSKTEMRKTEKTPDLRKILSKRTKEDLIGFLVKISAENEEIGQRIELDFSDGNDEEEIRQCVKLIRAYVGKNSDRHGFVDYDNTYEATEGAGLVLEKARAALKKKKNIQALTLALCVVHEMIALLESADDSDGFIGGNIDEAFEFIEEITKVEDLNSSDREIIFNKLAKEAAGRRYEDWTDWKLHLLKCCSELANTQILRDACEKLLAQTAKEKDGGSWNGSYLIEQINLIRYNMIKKNDGPGKARNFIDENLKYSSFRKMAIENAMREKDYDTVERLALDGENLDNDKLGLVQQWMEYRYAAYQKAGNLEKQRAVAMRFILDGRFEYYMELKRTYRTDDWHAVYPQIISRLESQKKTYSRIYPQILIEEAEKQKLCEYVKNRPSEIEYYYKHLLPEFKNEVYGLFMQHIEETAANSDNRKDYRRVCAIIRTLKKAGGREQAAQAKQKLLMKYPNRPAFKDELSRV